MGEWRSVQRTVVASIACVAAQMMPMAAERTNGAIDREAVVSRHNVVFYHPHGVNATTTQFDALTTGNGEFGFTADLTGLQSLNNSYHTPQYPLYTMSNWGWHTPDPSRTGAIKQPAFQPNGELNYVYENVSINSSDTRPGKGNRTVPYQFNCASYNDPALCSFWDKFPARVNLGQLSFVLAQPPPPPAPPFDGGECSGIGTWCSGRSQCGKGEQLLVAAAKPGGACNATATCSWSSGWHNAPFCTHGGEINMTGVTPGKANLGYFSGSCDKIQWNNTFDSSYWCREGSPRSSCSSQQHTDGQPAGDFRFIRLGEISAANQTLDMYTGLLESNWTHIDAQSLAVSEVSVVTAVDSETDSVATRYTAPAAMPLAVQLAFCTLSPGGYACDWSPSTQLSPHTTTVLKNTSSRLDLARKNGDHDTYSVSCSFSGAPGLVAVQTAEHAFAIHRPAMHTNSGSRISGSSVEKLTVDIVCRYQLGCCVGTKPATPAEDLMARSVPAVDTVLMNSHGLWKDFWERGAFIDIASATSDPQAFELERRTIQSLYLMRSQEAGSMPPQESGLLYNSWTGKHHSEMRYWHQTWMPLWSRPELLRRSDEWFLQRQLNATSHTTHQGYKGTRWGKMLGESNMQGIGKGEKALMYWESPNNINPGLVWHQPHVIYMSELEYRAAANTSARNEVLQRLKGIVESTAEFIADFPERRIGTGTDGQYLDLGPPLVSASEGEGPYDVWNPTYELTQFNFSLDIANHWRERLGLGRKQEWDDVRFQLAPLPITTAGPSGKPTYNRHQNCLPSVFAGGGTHGGKTHHCSGANSHPALNGAMGCLPGDQYGVDRAVMNNTLHETLGVWNWAGCWGWDQPMVSMTATRLEQPQIAVDTLLMPAPTNVYIATGYNHPSRKGIISAYLPGNGGILIAVGLMAGGWANGPKTAAPGFPAHWSVKAEGFIEYF